MAYIKRISDGYLVETSDANISDNNAVLLATQLSLLLGETWQVDTVSRGGAGALVGALAGGGIGILPPHTQNP